jgi:hypothetical protein
LTGNRSLFCFSGLVTAVGAFGRAASQFPMQQRQSYRAAFRSRCGTRNQLSSRSDEPYQPSARTPAAQRPPPRSLHLRVASWCRPLWCRRLLLNPAAILADSTFNSIFVHDLSPIGLGPKRLAGRSVDRLNLPSAGQPDFPAAGYFTLSRPTILVHSAFRTARMCRVSTQITGKFTSRRALYIGVVSMGAECFLPHPVFVRSSLASVGPANALARSRVVGLRRPAPAQVRSGRARLLRAAARALGWPVRD